MKLKENFDSLIFDMDGTLWDAVDSYCEIWNVTSGQLGIDRVVTRDELIDLMGCTIDVIMERLFRGREVDTERYLDLLDRNERLMMPRLGGRLYPDVMRRIPELSRRYRLFMASNCGSDGLRNFLKFTKLEPYFEDTITYGETLKDKQWNIRVIADRNNLKNPLYLRHRRRLPERASGGGENAQCHLRLRICRTGRLLRRFIRLDGPDVAP